MSIGDILSSVGSGLATAGRVAGAVAGPVIQSLAEEESGQAPEIQAERRRQKMALQQQSVANDVNDLQNQLAMGIKYGTLNEDQQGAYKKAIAQKYMDAISQAAAPGGNLTERLHAAVHGGGAPYQPYTAPLASATPEGGTQKRDVDLAVEAANAKKGVRPVPGVRPFLNTDDGEYYQPMYDAHGGVTNERVDNYKPPSPKKALAGVPPFQGPDKKWYRAMTDNTGAVTNEEIPNYTPPPPKSSGTVSAQYAALFAKDLLARSGKGPQLTSEEEAQKQGLAQAMTIAGVSRANAMAAATARYNLVQVQDPHTGADVWVPKMNVIAASQGGAPAMTSKGSQKAMLAASALQQINTIKDLIDAHPDLVGPVSGRINAIQQMGGVQSPDFARFTAAATYLAEHGSGVFGSRAVGTVHDLEKAITDPSFNADAMKASLDQAEITNQSFLNPQGAQVMSPTGAKSVGDILPKTGAGAAGAHKVGDTKKFPNGKTGVWDGTGWVAQ